jgi:hypothetical protein
MILRMSDLEPWIGLAEITPGDPRPPEIDEAAGGAFTHFVCMSTDARAFRVAAAQYFRSEGWRLVDLQDSGTVAQRVAAGLPSGDVMDAIDRVRRTGQPDTADEWDLYPIEDDCRYASAVSRSARDRQQRLALAHKGRRTRSSALGREALSSPWARSGRFCQVVRSDQPARSSPSALSCQQLRSCPACRRSRSCRGGAWVP